jgi:hypothetical protein
MHVDFGVEGVRDFAPEYAPKAGPQLGSFGPIQADTFPAY